MITTRFIQRELAEVRRMIQQDFRDELRAVFDSGTFCPNCPSCARKPAQRDVAALRRATIHDCIPTPPVATAGFDATRDDTCKLSVGVHFNDSQSFDSEKPSLDEIPLSMPGQAPSLAPISDDSYQLLPVTDVVRDLRRCSTSSSQIGSNVAFGCQSKIHDVTDRWAMLCSGLLGFTSVLHSFWLPRQKRASLTGLCQSLMLPTISERISRKDSAEAPPAWWILDPFSTRRFSWDIIGIVLCLYDLIMVPVLMAFTLPPSYESFRLVRDAFSTCFWSLDVVMSFITGRPDRDGMVEVNPRKIARQYATTWLSLDLMIVTIDWIVLLLSAIGLSGSMRIGKAFTRILRASRLLRILKMSEKVREVMGTVETEFLFTVVTVMKQIALLLTICHYSACAWYSIGTMHDDSTSWPRVFLSGNDSIWYAYAASLHYSLTQFTFGYGDITPQTVYEFFYVNIVLVVAVLVFSMVTSQLSKAIAHLEKINAAQLAQDVKVRQFCSENQIPRHLMARVRNFMRQRSRSYNCRMVNESDIEVFQALPLGIRQKLRESRFMRHLLSHPLFEQLSSMEVNSRVLHELCWSGLEETFLLPGQEYFTGGAKVNRMIFLLTGQLRYRLGEDDIIADDAIILPGQWACEEALWSVKSWLFAPFTSCDGSQLMLIVPDMLREIVERDAFVYDFLKVYAKLFIERINEASCDEAVTCVLFNEPTTISAMVREAWKSYARATEQGQLPLGRTVLSDDC